MNGDIYIYNLITGLFFYSSFGQVLALLAASVLIWGLIVWYVVAVFIRRSARPAELYALLFGGSMVYLFNILVSWWWWRPRPFITFELVPLINVSAATKSFPSDHAALAFFIAFLLGHQQKKWRPAVYVLAATIALGRVAAGVHYPLDVLVGALVGLVFGYLAVKTEQLFI